VEDNGIDLEEEAYEVLEDDDTNEDESEATSGEEDLGSGMKVMMTRVIMYLMTEIHLTTKFKMDPIVKSQIWSSKIPSLACSPNCYPLPSYFEKNRFV
jgi:hypothetical protein